jgi:dephospho-CoA kinase
MNHGLHGTGSHLILGVTGGIASGKSTVSHMLEDLGAPAIDFDILAREVVKPGQMALKNIVNLFGPKILAADGTLDRPRLAQIVFDHPDKRKQLESITHPVILEAYQQRLKMLFRSKAHAIIQAVVPLLIEANLQKMCDKILLVYASPEIQLQRLMKRDHISYQNAQQRLQAQMPIDDKIRHADFIIMNDQSIDHARQQVETLWQSLKALQQKREKKPL